MKKWTRLIAAMLIAVVLLTGCSAAGFSGFLNDIFTAISLGTATNFSDMQYVRPDVDAFEANLAICKEQAKTAKDVKSLMSPVTALYNQYYDFYTNYALANIHYCKNMTDIYWDEEYSWCLENASRIDSGLDQLLYALADSPLREALETEDYFGENFFDAYEGESLWDETFTALMNQEAALLDDYYELEAQSATVEDYQEFMSGYGYELEKVYAELVIVRQEIAEYAGYESYGQFAYEFTYQRDYTAQQAQDYVRKIAQELSPLYLQMDNTTWDALYTTSTEEDTYAYLKSCVAAVGGVAEDALKLMEKAGLYDIAPGENKYGASFETFLYAYYEPFLFMNPSGYSMDKLTLVHEFGHFCNDYAVSGTVVGIDVAEVFSQGLEYLSICCTEEGKPLQQAKMADSLSVFVEQSLYAAFEFAVYELEEVTVENIRNTFSRTCKEFGFDGYGIDRRAYATVPHFYIAPMYVISYVVSNDVAMQLYQAEAKAPGEGVRQWENGLFSMQAGLLGFVEEMDLTSPFAEGRIEQIRDTLKAVLK